MLRTGNCDSDQCHWGCFTLSFEDLHLINFVVVWVFLKPLSTYFHIPYVQSKFHSELQNPDWECAADSESSCTGVL